MDPQIRARRRHAQTIADARARDLAERSARSPYSGSTGDAAMADSMRMPEQAEEDKGDDTVMEKWHKFNQSNPWVGTLASVLGGAGGFLLGGPAGALAGSALGSTLTSVPGAAHAMKAINDGDWGEAAKTGALEVVLPTLSIGGSAALATGAVKGVQGVANAAAATGRAIGRVGAAIDAAPGAAARAIGAGASNVAGAVRGGAGRIAGAAQAGAGGVAGVLRRGAEAGQQAARRAGASIRNVADVAGSRLHRVQTRMRSMLGGSGARATNGPPMKIDYSRSPGKVDYSLLPPQKPELRDAVGEIVDDFDDVIGAGAGSRAPAQTFASVSGYPASIRAIPQGTSTAINPFSPLSSAGLRQRTPATRVYTDMAKEMERAAKVSALEKYTSGSFLSNTGNVNTTQQGGDALSLAFNL